MSGPAPQVAAVRSAVRAAVEDLPAGALVLVACSGGPDSLALAAGLAFVAGHAARRASGAPVLRAGAVVVDHGLQDGSAQTAQAAADACRALGLDPVRVVRVDATGPGGPEAAARAARYAAFDDVVRETGAAAVLLGHTLDDQAETVLLGLARGSGARSLAGMAPTRGVLRRPLLGLRRADTLAACAAQGLAPWHDPTNAAEHPASGTRSQVRDRVLPVLDDVLGPGVAAALARTAEQLREDADALDGLAAALVEQATAAAQPDDERGRPDDEQRPPDGEPAALVVLDCRTLAGAPAALRRRALRAAALAAGSPAGALHRTHVLAMDALVVAWHGQGPVALPSGREARRSCGRLAVGPGRDTAGPDEAPDRAPDEAPPEAREPQPPDHGAARDQER